MADAPPPLSASPPLAATIYSSCPATTASVGSWDGHFAVDNTLVPAVSSTWSHQPNDRSPLTSRPHNGYASMQSTHPQHCDLSYYNSPARGNSDSDDTDGDNDAREYRDLDEEANRMSRNDDEDEEERRDEAALRPSGSSKSLEPPSGLTDALGIVSSTYSRYSSMPVGLGIRRHGTLSSSAFGDSMTEIVIDELQNEHEPTSAILLYCKRMFLRPYLVILSVAGLNPMPTDATTCRAVFSYAQACCILVVLLFGYIMQYICSYRGDRGFANFHIIFPMASPAVNNATRLMRTEVHTIGELLFGYIVPNTLHLCGFVSAIIVCKIVGEEQLQNLIERVFLMSMKPRRLCRNLWLYVFGGFLLLGILMAYVTPSVLMQGDLVQVKRLVGMLKDWQVWMKVFLLATLFVQDFIEIIVLTSYCIECYLLREYLDTLSQKLLMRSIDSLDWMREVLEFRKLLDHLNQRVSVPVCFFIIMNLAYAFAGFVYLFKDFDFHYSALKVVVLNIINVVLWLLMGLMPFFTAASVTRVCQSIQGNGHQIRVRPFVYHNARSEDLNSTLLFASSLRMSAKLFRMPIQPNYLCFAIVIVSIVVLTLGMCLNLSALGNF